MKVPLLIDFMRRLVRESRNEGTPKVFLVLDNLKAAITTKAPARRKGQLKEAAIGHLRHLQKSPKKVQQFFGKDSVKYAA